MRRCIKLCWRSNCTYLLCRYLPCSYWSCICLILAYLLCGCESKDEQFNLDELAKQAEATSDVEENVWSKLHISGGETAKESGQEVVSHTDRASGETGGIGVLVHVCGAVVSPGVVVLDTGSRALDAVEAAGGFTQDAQQDYVNLAAFVSDGEQLYIPTVEEVAGNSFISAREGKELVNLNTADAALLCTLPGIGETRAADIIAYREKYGGFSSIEEIMKVPGIKESTFAKLKSLITAK